MTFYFFLQISILALLMAFAQVLLKYGASNIIKYDDYFHLKIILPISTSLFLYFCMTLFWIFILKQNNLGHSYPFLALSIVLVSIGGWYFFDEEYSFTYLIGLLLVVLGLFLIAKS